MVAINFIRDRRTKAATDQASLERASNPGEPRNQVCTQVANVVPFVLYLPFCIYLLVQFFFILLFNQSIFIISLQLKCECSSNGSIQWTQMHRSLSSMNACSIDALLIRHNKGQQSRKNNNNNNNKKFICAF